VVTLRRNPFTPGERASRCPLNRGLGGHQSRSGRLVENFLALTRIRMPDRPARKLFSFCDKSDVRPYNWPCQAPSQCRNMSSLRHPAPSAHTLHRQSRLLLVCEPYWFLRYFCLMIHPLYVFSYCLTTLPVAPPV
jgi:hypothetical protein